MFIFTLLRRGVEALSTFLLVTAIAALIWFYAEQRNVHDQTTQEFTVVFGDAKQREDYVITPASATVRLSFRSNNSELDKFRKILDKEKGVFTLPLNIEKLKEKTSGIQTYLEGQTHIVDDLQSTLKENRLIISNLKLAQTQDAPIRAYLMETISVGLFDDLNSSGEVKFKPDHVNVRLPVGLAKQVKENQNKAKVNRESLRLDDVNSGDSITRTLPVEFPALLVYLEKPDSDVSGEEKKFLRTYANVSPAAVDVSFTVRKNTSKFKLTEPVRVQFMIPGSIQKDWVFEVVNDNEKNIESLELTTTLTAVENKSIYAFLPITAAPSADGEALSIEPKFHLPAGVSLSPSYIPPKITVRASRRAEK